MSQTLLKLARQFADSNADQHGLASTPVSWLRVLRSTGTGTVGHLIERPTVCLVLQGQMRQTYGSRAHSCSRGDSIVITNRSPAITEIQAASIAEPCVALLIEVDLSMVSVLVADMEAANCTTSSLQAIASTDEELATCALQLMRLVLNPSSLGVLLNPLVREVHYWILAGQHGATIRNLSRPDNTVRRVARAIAVIRSEFSKSLPIEHLAAVAGMSSSAFHQHFRAATSMTPLQYQKHIRLTEARRMMLSDGSKASSAAFSVGYQSISQFSRDYRKMFGLPPRRETSRAKSMKPVYEVARARTMAAQAIA